MSKQIAWIILVVVVLALAVGGYFLLKQESTNTNNSNSIVNSVTNTNLNSNINLNANTRLNGNTNAVQNANSTTNINSNANANINSSVDTSGWRTYSNALYGYSIKYPPNCNYKESTKSGGLLLTSWEGCGQDVFIDQLGGTTVVEWANVRNYVITETYAVNQLTFTIASFAGEEVGSHSLALLPHGSYMFRIDITEFNVVKLKALLATMSFTK